MGQVWKRMAALMLSALMVLPPAALAEEAGEEQPTETGGSVQVSFPSRSSITVTNDTDTIYSNDSASFTVTMAAGRALESVTVSLEKVPESAPQAEEDELEETSDENGEITLTKATPNNTLNEITASIAQWPDRSQAFVLTISAAELNNNSYKATVICSVSSNQNYAATIEENGGATVTGNAQNVARGSDVSLSVTPDKGYQLTGLDITYGEDSATLKSENDDWCGLQVKWDATGTSTISGKIYENLTVTVVVEKIPVYYKLTVDVGDGLTLEAPSSSLSNVLEGESQMIRVKAAPGYLISDCMVHYGKSYASWVTGQTYLVMGNTRVKVTEKSGEVSFVLPAIYDDTDILFTAGYDPDNIPVTYEEESHINIDADCGETVARGDDAEFYISTTSDRYSVKKITLTIGDSTGSADPEDGEIRVGKKNYEIESTSDGEYVVYVDNITEPVTLSASSSGSSSVSRPQLTIRLSSHMKITKSVSSNRIDAGEDVNFYFTPDKNYQVDEITVSIGDNSRTVGAEKTSIRVGGETYQMSRSASGVVSLFLTDIEDNVTVSGSTYYSKDAVQATGSIALDTDSRTPFMNGYSDGTFRPEENMTRAEAVVMLYRMCSVGVDSDSSESVYRDVPSNMWCAREVNAFADAGIIDRTTYFYPDQYITRAALTEMLYRLSGSPSVSSSTVYFTDISGATNSNAIRYAAASGWINGYPDGSFRPYAYIARSEVAAVMTRVLHRTYGGSGISYKDVPSYYWAYSYIQLASSYV